MCSLRDLKGCPQFFYTVSRLHNYEGQRTFFCFRIATKDIDVSICVFRFCFCTNGYHPSLEHLNLSTTIRSFLIRKRVAAYKPITIHQSILVIHVIPLKVPRNMALAHCYYNQPQGICSINKCPQETTSSYALQLFTK